MCCYLNVHFQGQRVKFTSQRLSLSDDSLSTQEKKSSLSTVLRVMTWNVQYNSTVIVKHDEDIIDVLQESCCVVLCCVM